MVKDGTVILRSHNSKLIIRINIITIIKSVSLTLNFMQIFPFISPNQFCKSIMLLKTCSY